jgi:exodeoxyribonuclease VII large subunit
MRSPRPAPACPACSPAESKSLGDPAAALATITASMSGTIELDRDGRSLLIRFPYSEYLVQEVRNLPGRRWDKAQKVWRVPAEQAEAAVDAFMKHGFSIAPDVFAVLAGTQDLPPAEKKPSAAAPPVAAARAATTGEPGTTAEGSAAESPRPLTVGQLNERVRAALNAAFSDRVSVVGEVFNYDKNKDRQHLFFSLVEKDPAGRKVAANVDVALFERTAKRLLPELERKGLTLRDGIEILVEAKVDLYPATGRYQLIIEDVRPEFTLGQLALSREQILEELRAAKLDERNAALPLPVPALRVGVLTSPDSDGWNDFLRELGSSEIGFQLTLYPVKVQGDGLRPTVLAGLRWFAERAEDFDLLCIVRGGGSRTDLAWFDDKEIAFAAARHPLKILCGIGHERDRSVLDEITLGLKTPTATAAFLIRHWQGSADELADLSRQLREAARDLLGRSREELGTQAQALRRIVHGRMIGERHRLAAAGQRIVRGSAGLLREHGRNLGDAARRARSGAGAILGGQLRLLERAGDRLRTGSQRRLDRAAATLTTAEARQRLLDPRHILRRGYALLRDAEGRIVTEARGLRADQDLVVQLRDGRARARITEVELTPPEEPEPQQTERPN